MLFETSQPLIVDWGDKKNKNKTYVRSYQKYSRTARYFSLSLVAVAAAEEIIRERLIERTDLFIQKSISLVPLHYIEYYFFLSFVVSFDRDSTELE